MSKFVDERVVEMSFDNKRFESNVKTSMGTINDLKNSLDFSGTANSLNKNLNNVNVGGLSGAIMSAKNSFTAFEIAGIAAIANITNRVIELGVQMVKSLSTDQISAGWGKFGQTAISEATLLAQSFEQEDVTAILDKLLWYADETSYSFTDMVDNLSKFTASGQGLEESATAMMGIANWAALSGQNAGVASRAMYQLSQAMSTGNVRLMDYKSIQNANMDTKEFRETVLKTAVALEQLVHNADDTYTTLSGKSFNVGQFTTELDELWFTSEVLMESLEKYSSGSNKLYEKIAQDSTINTASQAIEKYGSELNDFELKAFLAAQEARTFKDAIVAVKDAVASGWMNIFTNIFGSVAEAKILWSNLANELYDVFMDGMWTKIDILGIWADNGGRDDLFANTEENTGAFWNLFNAIVAIKDLIGGAWQKVFGFSDLEDYDERVSDIAGKLKTFTENLKTWTEGLTMSGKATEVLTDIFTGLFSILKMTGKTIIAVWRGFSPLLEVMKPLLGYILGALGLVGKEITEFSEKTTVFEKITKGMQSFFNAIINFVKSLALLEGVTTFIDSFRKSLNKVLGETGANVSAVSGFKSVVNAIANAFKWLADVIANYVLPVLPKAFSLFGKGLGWVVGHAIKFINKMGELIYRFKEWAKANLKFQNGMNTLRKVLASIGKVFNKLIKSISRLFKSFGKTYFDVSEKFNPLKIFVKGLLNLFEGLWTVLKAVIPVIGSFFSFIGRSLTYVGDKLNELFRTDGEVDFKKIFTVGFWAVVAIGVYRFANMLRSITEVFRDAFDGMFDFFNSVAMKNYMQAIQTMAISILLMVGALLILGAMDPGELHHSLMMMGVLIGFIVGVMLLMKKLVAGSAMKSYIKEGPDIIKKSLQMTNNTAGLGAAFLGLGLAVLLLTTSLWMITKLDPKQVEASLLYIAALMAMLAITMRVIGKNDKESNKAIRSMIKTAISVALLVKPLQMIGSMRTKVAEAGLKRIRIMLMIMAGYSIFSRKIEKSHRPINNLIITAMALTLLTVPMKIIGEMEPDKWLLSMASLFFIFGMMAAYSRVVRLEDAMALTKFSWQLIVIAVALAAFGVAISLVGKSGPDAVILAGEILAGVFGILIFASYALREDLVKGVTKVIWSLIPLSVALAAFGIAMHIISLANDAAFWKLMMLLGAVFIAVSVSNASLKPGDVGGLIRVIWMLIPLAAGLAAFGLAMQIVSKSTETDIGYSFTIIAGVLALMIFASHALPEDTVTGVVKVVWLLLPLAAGLAAFGLAMQVVSKNTDDDMLRSAYVLLGVFAILIAASKLMTLERAIGIAKIMWAMLALSTSLLIFGLAMGNLARVDWNEIWGSLLVLGAVLLFVSGIAILLQFVGSGSWQLSVLAASMIILSVAMVAIGYALLFLAAIPIDKMIHGMIIFLSVLTVLTIISIVIFKAIIPMLALAGVLALFSLSILMLAAGFTALTVLAGMGAPLMAAGLIAVATAIILAAPIISKALWTLAIVLVDVLTNIIPYIVDGLDVALRKVLPVVGMLLVDLTWDLIVWLAKLIWIGTVWLAKITWDGIKLLWNGMISLIAKIDAWIDKVIFDIFRGIVLGIKKAWNWVVEIINKFGNWLWSNLVNITTSIVNGIKNAWTGVTTWLGNAFKNVSLFFKEGFASLKQIGKDAIQFLKDGIIDKWEELKIWVKDKAGSFGKWFEDGWSAIKEAGKNLVNGLIQGIKDGWNSIKDGLQVLGDKAVEFFSKLLGINSPSTVFAEIGKYLDLGLAKGIEDNSDSVYDATGSLGDEAADGISHSGLSKVLSDLNKSLSSDFDNQITLTPVLDLTEIQNGKNQLISMMKDMNSSYDISGSNDIANRTADEISRGSSRVQGKEDIKQGNTISEVVNNNFNITGSSPKEIASEISRILQAQVERRRAKWGT